MARDVIPTRDAVRKTATKAGKDAVSKALGPSGTMKGFAQATLTPIDGKDQKPFVFMFNPNSIQMSKKVQWDEKPEQGNDQGRQQFKSGMAWDLKLPEIIIDTYETKEDVSGEEYVGKLENFLYVEEETHAAPRLMFAFGEFAPDFAFVATGLDVTYEMFLANGTPVRAKASLTLKSYETKKERQDKSGDTSNKSPDHARIYTVRRGDTLAMISQYAYDTPSKWRHIARYNDIEDPLRLDPGTRLLLPPILK